MKYGVAVASPRDAIRSTSVSKSVDSRCLSFYLHDMGCAEIQLQIQQPTQLSRVS